MNRFSVLGFCGVIALCITPALSNADTISKPHTFIAGSIIKSSEVNANFDTVYGQVNKTGGAITVDGVTGNVGIGTTTPEVKLHLSGTGTGAHVLLENTDGTAGGDYPSLTAVSYNAGHSSLIGERAGGTKANPSVAPADSTLQTLVGRGHDGTSFQEAGRISILSGSNFSTDQIDGVIQFQVRNNNVANSAMTILETGNVGIGTTTPAATLDVNGFMKLAVNSSAPATCDATHDGSLALANDYRTCVCKFGAGWVYTSDGTTACGNWNPSASVDIASTTLVINEVNYNDPGADLAEFVEIVNISPNVIDLSDYALFFFDGATQSDYYSISLSGILPSGGYHTVGSSNATPDQVIPDSTIMNSNAGVGLFLLMASPLQLVDALSYEGQLTSVMIGGAEGPYNLVETAPTFEVDSATQDGSLARCPDGRDGGVSAADWMFNSVTSPGSTNVCY